MKRIRFRVKLTRKPTRRKPFEYVTRTQRRAMRAAKKHGLKLHRDERPADEDFTQLLCRLLRHTGEDDTARQSLARYIGQQNDRHPLPRDRDDPLEMA